MRRATLPASGGSISCGEHGNRRVRQAAAPVNENRQGVDHMKRFLIGLAAATAMTLPAFAQDIQPAIIYDLGGKFDKYFNEAA